MEAFMSFMSALEEKHPILFPFVYFPIGVLMLIGLMIACAWIALFTRRNLT